MNEKDLQNLTPNQLFLICGLALRKIQTDIAFLSCRVDLDQSLELVDPAEKHLFDCGILVGLNLAEKAFLDVYSSGIWKVKGGSENG